MEPDQEEKEGCSPEESHDLRLGTTIWVWFVRLGRGRWWPGTVKGLRTIQGQIRVAVKFECARGIGVDNAPVLVGMSTTAMRYVELRKIESWGIDRPTHPPVSLLRCPEQSDGSGNEPAGLGVAFSSMVTEGPRRHRFGLEHDDRQFQWRLKGCARSSGTDSDKHGLSRFRT